VLLLLLLIIAAASAAVVRSPVTTPGPLRSIDPGAPHQMDLSSPSCHHDDAMAAGQAEEASGVCCSAPRRAAPGGRRAGRWRATAAGGGCEGWAARQFHWAEGHLHVPRVTRRASDARIANRALGPGDVPLSFRAASRVSPMQIISARQNTRQNGKQVRTLAGGPSRRSQPPNAWPSPAS
jgi:hypothetical protein